MPSKWIVSEHSGSCIRRSNALRYAMDYAPCLFLLAFAFCVALPPHDTCHVSLVAAFLKGRQSQRAS